MTDYELRLKPLPLINARFALVTMSLLILGAIGALVISTQVLTSVAVWTGYGVSLGLVITACVLANLRRTDATNVILHGNRLTIPVPRGFGRRAVTVEVANLRSVELTSRHGPELTLGLHGRFPLSVHSRQVIGGSVPELHRQLVRLASALNPNLAESQALFERRSQPPLGALLVAACLVTVFLASQTGNDDPVHQLIALGGLNDWLVAHGEIYRLGAAALLHANWSHLLLNLTFLLVIALRLEFVVGPAPLISVVGVGMIAGNLCALLAYGHTVVIGASGGAFALVALYAVTICQRRAHLPSRTLFASYAYLLAGLALLFVPLPGYAYSAHVGGFAGGACWSLLAGRRGAPRRLALALGVVAWAFILVAAGYGFSHRAAWLQGEPALIERMAADPDTGIGTLNLVGWYALRHDDRRLQAVAAARLDGRGDHTAGSLGTLAELLLEQGEAARAARIANTAFERDSDRDARTLLLRAEAAARAGRCRPVDHTAAGAAPPVPARRRGDLVFESERPLYVHAIVGDTYMLVRSGLPVEAPPGDVTVLGYGDRLPWRRKPWRLRVPATVTVAGCPDG